MATALFTSTTEADDFYPDRDGKPMAETPVHQNVMIDLIVGLRDWFADDPQVYVAGNLFVYFVEGDPTRNVSPDVMVVRGVDRDRDRNSYKVWEDDGKGPDLIIEVSSKSTRREDLRQKFLLYRDELKVREYFVFDPLGEYLKPQLQGFRLEGDDYFAIDLEAGRLPSEVLGLHLVATGRTVRLFDPRIGRIVPDRLEALQAQEAALRAQEAALQAQEAASRAQEAVIRERDAAIEAQEAALGAQARAIQSLNSAVQVQESSLRERETLIAEQSRALQQKEIDLARANLERDRLLAEIARLQSLERSG